MAPLLLPLIAEDANMTLDRTDKRPDAPKDKIKEPPKKDKAERELPPNKEDKPETPRIVDQGPV